VPAALSRTTCTTVWLLKVGVAGREGADGDEQAHVGFPLARLFLDHR
jgi:hypothetical protein